VSTTAFRWAVADFAAAHGAESRADWHVAAEALLADFHGADAIPFFVPERIVLMGEGDGCHFVKIPDDRRGAWGHDP
jgi:hypothetical protein